MPEPRESAKSRLLWSIAGIGLIGAGVLLLLSGPRTISASALIPYQPDLANGEVMFNAGGCASCHAAPAKGKACDDPKSGNRLDLAGGRCLRTGFGTFYAPNISPDRESGIGSWSELDFVTAMLRGVSPSGEHYYPAFPYTSYQRMPLEDVRDLKAYLDTLPAVRSKRTEHELSFPYSIRWGLGFWKLLYLDGETFAPDPAKSDEVNRGAYLVEGPGHCAECHTPRDSFGGLIADRSLAGAPAPEGKGRTPNLTPHKSGLADWSLLDIAYALKSGFTPEFDVLGSTMAKVQENMARLGDADRRAIAAYLKSVPAIESRKRETPPQ